MSELRDRFESIIEDAADDLHDSTLWWDEDFADNGTTIIANLCKRLEDAARGVAPKLPRVSPENLVEGRWYVVSLPSYVGSSRVTEPCLFVGGCILEAGSECEHEVSDALAIWGPIPRFELEGDA